MTTPLSVLDLAPIGSGRTTSEALDATTRLARRADELGYRRFWVAEHHNIPSVASTAPEVLIAHIAANTERIRVGSGGVMLPNHAPLAVAERFGMLEALHPNRIDLGLGRAPGTDPLTARALRRTLTGDVDDFPDDVVELMTYFRPAREGQAVRAVPGAGAKIETWILGSSLYGAQLAAALGLPYAFASHFAPGQLMQAIEVYRDRFRPSEHLAKPYLMLGANVIAAGTDEEGRLLLTSLEQAFVALRRGRPAQLPPPLEGFGDQLAPHERATLDAVLSCSFVGSRETVRSGIEDFLARTGADELIIAAQIHDHAARRRSYEIAASIRDELAGGTARAADS